MIVICEDCGKKYRIDPSKIKGKTAKFKCKACNHIITVSKPEPKPPESPQPPPFIEADSEVSQQTPPAAAARIKKKISGGRSRIPLSLKLGSIGLRTKMIVLFFFIPIVFFAASSFLITRQMNTLAGQLTDESTRIVTKMAEDKMADIARAVATQCKLYLLGHPGLRKEKFIRDSNFKRLAVQKVGMTGYTALYELPGPDGIWRTWSHVNPKIIGINMIKLKKPLGRNFDGFWRVYTGVKGGKESKGYYTWQDKDGRFRDKFMVCTLIEGTSYVVAATTYLDELTRNVHILKKDSEEAIGKTQNTIWIIWGVTLLLIGAIVLIYGQRLAGRIKSLTDVAERISVGELEEEVPIKSKDELGELAEAISRMQDSIRLSIERLRRRRSNPK